MQVELQIELADAYLLHLAAAKVCESLNVCRVEAVHVPPNNGSAFNGRPGDEPHWIYKDRSPPGRSVAVRG
jgi:hypothetical protein